MAERPRHSTEFLTILSPPPQKKRLPYFNTEAMYAHLISVFLQKILQRPQVSLSQGDTALVYMKKHPDDECDG